MIMKEVAEKVYGIVEILNFS